MDTDTLLQHINAYQTLVHDGEIKFLFYQKKPTHPDDIGKEERTEISLREEQKRDNIPKSRQPEAIRRRLLDRIESEEKHDDSWDSNAKVVFLEGNLAFQVFRGKGKPGEPWTQYNYRLEKKHLLESFPSVEYMRFFDDRLQKCTFSDSSKLLKIILPPQFDDFRDLSSSKRINFGNPTSVTLSTDVPPGFPLTKGGKNEVFSSKIDSDEHAYLLTYKNSRDLEIKNYVRLKNELPEVFQQEFYHKYELPNTDTERNWLLILRKYRDFEWVPELNITLPKVREEKRFRPDGSMHEHTILTILEMDFNIGFPADFFEWKEIEPTDWKESKPIVEVGGRKYIRCNVEPNRVQQKTQNEMVRIEGGTVDPFGTGETITVSPFYLDKLLVTYEQYEMFIQDGGYKKKEYWSKEGQEFLENHEFRVPSTYNEGCLNRKNLPVTGVSWYEVEAYANWRGIRMPSAAEWTLACQGDAKRRYPWGNDFDFEAIDYPARLAPYVVGSQEKNVSATGIYDLVGNVWQWCADSYEGRDFRLDAEPTGTKPGPQKILRGGSWMSLRRHFESDYLYYDKPTHRLATYGFRCAKDVE